MELLSCHASSILSKSHHCGSVLLASHPGAPITWTKINWLTITPVVVNFDLLIQSWNLWDCSKVFALLLSAWSLSLCSKNSLSSHCYQELLQKSCKFPCPWKSPLEILAFVKPLSLHLSLPGSTITMDAHQNQHVLRSPYALWWDCRTSTPYKPSRYLMKMHFS